MGIFSTTHRHYDNSTSINYPEHTTVTEKKAPTDESIRLFDEYLEKTKDKVLSVFKLESTYVHAVCVAFCHNDMTVDMPAIQYRIRFKLNENTEEIKFELDGFEYKKLANNHPDVADAELINMIHKKIADIISLRMIQQVKTTHLGANRNHRMTQ